MLGVPTAITQRQLMYIIYVTYSLFGNCIFPSPLQTATAPPAQAVIATTLGP